MIKNKVTVNIYGLMVENIWEIGLMENKMELELMSIKMVQKEKDFGNKAKESNGLMKLNKHEYP